MCFYELFWDFCLPRIIGKCTSCHLFWHGQLNPVSNNYLLLKLATSETGQLLPYPHLSAFPCNVTISFIQKALHDCYKSALLLINRSVKFIFTRMYIKLPKGIVPIMHCGLNTQEHAAAVTTSAFWGVTLAEHCSVE